jgi:hypothetical protein
MRALLNPLANLLAVIGIVLVLFAGFWRLSGNFTLMGIGTIAVMQAGMAALLAACLGKLEVLLGNQAKS